ncbi:MAG: hypothetical protein HQ570_02690 [Candidatus Omnitrophica bacterium]|nr:hypothetical protein [Candidatus Omnitrophota bacterium]
MRIKLKLFIFCLLLAVSATSIAWAENDSLEDIFTSPKEFSEQQVQIEGEVIGEALRDAQGVWINISSGSSQIGVFSSDKSIIERIAHWGSYEETGDQLRITGIFYKECPDHQISDLHLASLEILREGYRNEYPISPQKQQLAKIFSMICLAIALVYLIRLKYGKRD